MSAGGVDALAFGFILDRARRFMRPIRLSLSVNLRAPSSSLAIILHPGKTLLPNFPTLRNRYRVLCSYTHDTQVATEVVFCRLYLFSSRILQALNVILPLIHIIWHESNVIFRSNNVNLFIVFILFSVVNLSKSLSLPLKPQLIYRYTETFIGRSLKTMRHERDHSLVGRSKDFSVSGANHRRPSRPNRNKFGADYTLRVTVHVRGRGDKHVCLRVNLPDLYWHIRVVNVFLSRLQSSLILIRYADVTIIRALIKSDIVKHL